MDGFRAPAKLTKFSKETGITAGTFGEVGRWGEALVLSVLGSAAGPNESAPRCSTAATTPGRRPRSRWTHAFKLLR